MAGILIGNSSNNEAVGTLGFKGETGDSAYEIAVKHGYQGTEAEWADSFLNADNYYDKSEIDTTLANYDTSSKVDTKLADYDTSAEVDTKLDARIKSTHSTSTTDTYSCAYLNRSIISAGPKVDVTPAALDYTKIGLGQLIAQSGDTNKLSLANDKITIGAGVSKVLVSAQFNVQGSGTTKNLSIYKNGESIILSQNSQLASGSSSFNRSFTITPMLVEVQQGDYFELYLYANTSDHVPGNYLRTYITIEVIE